MSHNNLKPKLTEKYNDDNNNIQTSKTRTNVLESSDLLLKFRIVFYGVNLLFVLYTTYQLVNIDFRGHGDDRLLFPEHIRMRYYTIWNYALHLIYNPWAMACDWLELKRRHNTPGARKLNEFRNMFATGLMAPATLYVDLVFWVFWIYDRELIVPSYNDVIISFASQNCLHTLTLTTVFVDWLSVPRRKPEDTKYHHTLYSAIMITYAAVILATFFETGQWIYPFMNTFGSKELLMFLVLSLSIKYALFSMQWKIIEAFWNNSSRSNNKNKIK